MATIWEFFTGAIWCVMFAIVCVIVMAIAVLLLSGLVHLIAYLNKRGRRV